MVDLASAAASAALQALFEKVLNTLSTFTGYEYRLLLGGDNERVNQDLEKLVQTLQRFRDDELKIFKHKETREWYNRVKCVVNEADRILEALDSDSDSDSDDGHQKRVCNPFPTWFAFSVSKRNKFGEGIASLLKKFNSLEVQKAQLNLEEINLTLHRETISTSSEVVFGRDDEKEQIVQFLLSEATTQCNNGPRICAIIGLGGIGKTTLARLIYNDKRVVQNFELKIWVWVSQTFEVKNVMEMIIETVSRETRKFGTLETTQNHLKNLLSDKKFLLVLDDVWNEEEAEWNKLKSPLNFGALGSSILLTTRGSVVASTARAHGQLRIRVLSKDQCWQLFKENAFLEGNEENGTLEMIGKQIAKKCGGLPLAAKSLGGSLRLTREVHEWESIRDSPIWELSEPCEILPALKLSLDSLKSYSRDCFTFCCVFPKGHEMEKEELIQLWMANDLIPSHQRLGLEDMGNKIFNDLVLKSFFQVSLYYLLEDCDTIYNRVTMHDVMHDLGLSFRTECFCLPDVSKIPTQCQHLFIKSSSLSRKANSLQTLSKSHSSLRTLLIHSFGENIITMNLNCSLFFSNLQCLRALDLRGIEIEDLPKSIGEIKDLKYLNLEGQRDLTHLPDSIGALTKLQTLKLRNCHSLTRLPDGITQLVSLRHLDIRNCDMLTCLPDEIAGLVNLRHLDTSHCWKLTRLPAEIAGLVNLRHLDTSHCSKLTYLADEIAGLVNLRHLKLPSYKGFTHLPDGIGRLINLVHLQRLELGEFVVGPDNGQRITKLQGLNRLKGSLTIRGLEQVRDAREAEAAVLNNKKNLSSLSLIWEDLHGSNSNSDKVEGVLEALQPPQSLNKLVIDGYGGSVFASWMKLLENLVRIELSDCIKCEHLPPLGQLPLLVKLIIAGMNSLKCINTEFYGINGSSSSERGTVIFPSLKELWFLNMPNLEEWQGIERDSQQTDPCPRLKCLTLVKCPKLKSLPSEILYFLQELKIRGCDKVIVRSLSRLTRLELNGEGTNSVTSLQNLDALEVLHINGYNELTSLPDESLSNLISLKKLEIRSCPALQSVPVMMNSSIVKLLICICPSLKSLSQSLQYLSTLKYLYIIHCDQLELSCHDFQNLISLQKLELGGLPKLISIPDLQHLSTLQYLEIRFCKSLTSLWPQTLQQNLTVHLKVLTLKDCEQLKLSSVDFQHLIKLHTIHLECLPKLISLPELQHLRSLDSLFIYDCKNLKELPQWLQNLTSLQVLDIGGCDHDLESRCAEDSGEYWPFIKHIPDVRVTEHIPVICINCDSDEETPPTTP